MGRVIGVWVLGLGGVAILLSLGIWQVQRLAWKEGILAEIAARIAADPVAVPAAPDAAVDRYLPVAVEGRFDADFVRVLVSQKGVGAGYRIISALETAAGRRVLVDRGVIPVAAPMPPSPADAVRVAGNLHWPEERDGFTPANDLVGNLWFARDVAALAAHLGAEPVLVIAREISPPEGQIQPLPVGIDNIPNDHLSYAVTWFSLALVWLGMTLFLLWRIRRGLG
ncbi:SURF1 family protein [Roseicyclus sp.]|uniref:SURF1 family protein n=1 Tax=Roseicyclus sp. TaxID=1914329 RepID=UPI003F6CD73F